MNNFIPSENSLVIIGIQGKSNLQFFFVKTVRVTGELIFLGGWFLTKQMPRPIDTALTVLTVPGDQSYFLKKPTDQAIRFFKNKLKQLQTPTSTPKMNQEIKDLITILS